MVIVPWTGSPIAGQPPREIDKRLGRSGVGADYRAWRAAPAHEEKTNCSGTAYAAAWRGSKIGAGRAASGHPCRPGRFRVLAGLDGVPGNTPSFILLPLGRHLCII